MPYDPINNPYIPGDPYSYDLKWMVDKIQQWTDPLDSAARAKASEEAAAASAEAADLSAQAAADSEANAKNYADHIADPVSSLVTEWLEDHITNPSNPPLDTSLTVAGAAADAKAVGDRLRYDIIQLPWLGDNTYPTGWKPRRYQGNIGDVVSTHATVYYICCHFRVDHTRYPQAILQTAKIRITPPSGYGVQIIECDNTNGEIVQKIGQADTQTYPEYAGVAQEFNVDFSQYYYVFTVGRFGNSDAGDYAVDQDFIDQIKLEILIPRKEDPKPNISDPIFFTVDVDRPLAFGGEEVIGSTDTVQCVLRLPNTYNPVGEPSRLVLACHGASGYIDESTSTWYNSNWTAFIDDLLAAGYACFDANVLPDSYGTSQMGFAVGSPLYVNVLKKAYDYILSNYNIKPQIFAHGTSMGGVGASAFAHAYPELVLAQSSFAGRDILLYLKKVEGGTDPDLNKIAIAFGYTDYAALTADEFSHVEGLYPSLSMMKYVSGSAQVPPARTDYNTWLSYFNQLMSYGRYDDEGTWTGCKKTPYKAWNSWADSIECAKLEEVLQKAFNRNNSVPYYVVNYESGTHTEISYGQINSMRDQLIAWYKRWE